MRLNRIAAIATSILFVLLVGLGGASSSLATQPSDGPPGQGECDHGNSEQSCVPDPQPSNGQDCDPHGNGGVNEDHCASEEPTSNPTTAPSTEPSAEPSVAPSVEPSSDPSATPSAIPSVSPSEPSTPTPSPSSAPSASPSPTSPPPFGTRSPAFTLPPTDANAPATVVDGRGGNLYFVLAGIVAIMTAVLLLTPRRARRR